jgi:hypothetical protein
LKKIADALAPEARGWGALIDGPGGIGKTSLAVRAAELTPAGRFKRIIFLSSKERELTADGQRALGSFVLPGYLDMFNAIARELGQKDIEKSVESERTELVLRALRDAEVLLVLDNLATLPESGRDQLFNLLNRLPRGCSAIVTSRRRADASAIVVRLDKLEWPAARDLIAELADISEAAAQVALSDLASRALVLPDVEEHQFALVPMVADFLRRKRPEAVAETGDRLTARAHALIVKNGNENIISSRYSMLPGLPRWLRPCRCSLAGLIRASRRCALH